MIYRGQKFRNSSMQWFLEGSILKVQSFRRLD